MLMTASHCIQSHLLRTSRANSVVIKGYIGKQLFEFLFMNGIQLVTKVKNNMKNSLMSVADKIMLPQKSSC